jgi:hypothetical protein
MANHSFEESYMEYIGMLLMLAGFEFNYIAVVNACHKGIFTNLFPES